MNIVLKPQIKTEEFLLERSESPDWQLGAASRHCRSKTLIGPKLQNGANYNEYSANYSAQRSFIVVRNRQCQARSMGQ